ncbi:MAG: helicase-exonuclease AddAB subunit AddA, partial [Eubacteriales bacterium]|nr:helicase-exonuclease AddAB subunit AddA [Eubacteriales bacterium]
IDRMLIMTFTRAAAGEMKERLTRALETALYEDPGNEHLERQMTLIHTAQITTIDGFCSYILRNYFHTIDLDPGYRVADEGELKLLKEDVLDQVLNEAYGEETEAFRHCVEFFCTGKNDDNLNELILKLYDTAQSDPNPEKWLRGCLKGYLPGETDENAFGWMEDLWQLAKEKLFSAKGALLEAREICLRDGGPYLYEDAIESDLLELEVLEQKALARDYEGMYTCLQNVNFARLSSKKMEAEERLKKQVKDLREEAKELMKSKTGELFAMSLPELREVMECCYEALTILVQLTLRFMEEFSKKKREKNLLDFGDIEHFALDILRTENEDGTIHPNQAARELSEKYDEVMVDEYQDSNMVQEIITQFVSGWAKNQKNIFMVGDVKQSIYRFRQAKPELFMEKYHNFDPEKGSEIRIDLHNNFRSRSSVLHSVNYLFRQLMGEDLGGVLYDAAAALYPGAEYPDNENPDFPKTEVLFVETEDPEYEDEELSRGKQELEALSIAQRIQEMVGKEMVCDRNGGFRPLEYGDIVVLLRSFSGMGETFMDVLSSRNIPVYAASRTGYFSATEVRTILNYLRVADNPRQDIPLAGVLTSPIGECTSENLALLKAAYPEGMLWDSVQDFLQEKEAKIAISEEERTVLQKKIGSFAETLQEIRRKTSYVPVHQLILEVLEETGYGRIAAAYPDGAQRSANLLMLVEKAMEYEKTSYRGLFNFVRYIEHLHKYEVDFGEVNLFGAGQGSVQIMTIHKSKGLEFPVVFAAGMGKQFNMRDTRAGFLVHPELGIGVDAVLPDLRLKVSSPQKKLIQNQIQKENLGEELRVLYVALTRAKEKLILTGTVKDLEKKLVKYASLADRKQELLPYEVREKAICYWDFVLPALMGHRSMDDLMNKVQIMQRKNPVLHEDVSEFLVRDLHAQDLVMEELQLQTGAELQKEVLLSWDPEKVYDETIREELSKRFQYTYPDHWLKDIPVKISVSELKKRAYHDEAELEESISYGDISDASDDLKVPGEKMDSLKDESSQKDKSAEFPEVEPIVPRFMQEKAEEVFTGSARGTAYHKVMQCLDYAKCDSLSQIKEQIENMVETERLSLEQAASVRILDIKKYLESPLGLRQKKAAEKRLLFREQPFMIMRESQELDASWHPGVSVLVQGIIDAYFMEGEDIVLVDYKTDRVRPGQEGHLLELYHVQLEDYACALERMTGRKVKEVYIYSFALGKQIIS